MEAIGEEIGLTQELSMRRWAQVVADPVLADLPYEA